ncbi:MAG: DUF4340 domain-containing protein, partial [Ignavibacteria bacterium]
MFSKINNSILTALFAVLLILVIIIFFVNSDKDERSFRDILVDIDTTAVSEIVINSGANNFNPLRIFKEKDDWFVVLKNSKTASVPMTTITRIFTELSEIKPKRLASRTKEKWSEFQVDSAGTRVRVSEGNRKTLDIVLGRINYQEQYRNVSTYVRLYNDNDVYETDGFLTYTFNQTTDTFRDGSVIKGDYNTWNNIKFEYPSDSSFTLIKLNGNWTIDNVETDSAKTFNYLKSVSGLNKKNFADDYELKTGETAKYKLTISNVNLEFIEVSA